MKVFVVFDETGRIYGAEYGEKPSMPIKINFTQSEIPDGAQITGVDVTDPDSPVIKYIEPKESVLEKQVKSLTAQIEYLSMMSGIEMEANNE